MTRDKELSMISAAVIANRVQRVPPAFVIRTKQAELSRDEELRRMKRLKVHLQNGWERKFPG